MAIYIHTPNQPGASPVAAAPSAATARLGAAHLSAAAALQSQAALRAYEPTAAAAAAALAGASPGARAAAIPALGTGLTVRPLRVPGGQPAADLEGAPSTLEASFNMPARVKAWMPKLVFVAMAYEKRGMAKVFRAVQAACAELELTVKRADEVVGTDIVLKRIAKLILDSQLLIFDLTHERPNVYYELGFAHGVGNSDNILLVARRRARVHFDVGGFHVDFYRNAAGLRDILRRKLPMMRAAFEAETDEAGGNGEELPPSKSR